MVFQGELFISKSLDRETVANYTLTIELQDIPTDGGSSNSNSFTVS